MANTMIVKKNVQFPFSKELQKIFDALNKDDELRIVGGCVRDFLINKEISDIDIACKYKPEETISILQKAKIRTIPTGIKHGTVSAIINGKMFEITTLRKDVESFGRSAKVEFIDDFFEDVLYNKKYGYTPQRHTAEKTASQTLATPWGQLRLLFVRGGKHDF